MTPILATRSDRAFERLYRRHVSDVYRYALAVLRNPSDAEDVTQTTFLNAYRAYQRGERPEKPRNWLIAIAHNVCRQRFRQAARRPDEVAFAEELAEAIVPDESAPTAEEIQRALGHLSFNQRAALVMRELEGRSYAEIAEMLDLSTSAVETLIFRARRALREQLEGALTCREAELTISRQLDGVLSRAEKGALRAHLRACPDCARVARKQRATRAALKGLLAIPLPTSLGSFFGGAATVGTAVGTKAAAVTAAGVLIGGGTYTAVDRPWQPKPAPRKAPVVAPVRSTPPRSAPPRSNRPAAQPASRIPGRGRGAPRSALPVRPQSAPGHQKVEKSPATPSSGRRLGPVVSAERSQRPAKSSKTQAPPTVVTPTVPGLMDEDVTADLPLGQNLRPQKPTVQPRRRGPLQPTTKGLNLLPHPSEGSSLGKRKGAP